MKSYRDPLSSKTFDDKSEYVSYLNELVWQMRSAMPWSWLYERKKLFQAARNELQNLHSLPDIMEWFQNNSHRLQLSPLVGIGPNSSPSPSYLSFKPLGGKFMAYRDLVIQDYSPFRIDPIDIAGPCWLIKVRILIREGPRPIGTLRRIHSGFSTLGLYMSEAPELIERSDSGAIYHYRFLMPAKFWPQLAFMEKLKGNIKERVI